jgi:Lrp/AsnC family transcriptional regulator, leucine-responsive regulatory protein
MTIESLDETDLRILEALQRDGRMAYAELAREVAMSASAVTERVRRLQDSGVISGYAAAVDAERLGLGIMAYVRLRPSTSNYKPLHDLLAVTPEIIEAHHVTGDDCFIMKVVARSMRHLEDTTGRISTLGAVTTNIIYSSPLPGRAIAPDVIAPDRAPTGARIPSG